MSEPAESVSLRHLKEQVDELSIRLIIEGAPMLCAGDFERLASSAAGLGVAEVEQAAQKIAERFDPHLVIPELTQLISAGLVEIRSLLDVADSESASSTIAPSPATLPDAIPSNTSRNHSLAADEDLIREFIIESTDHLVNIESQLLILERDSAAIESLNAIFRGFHTIKGLAGFLEFDEIRSLTHEVETLLDLARTSQLKVNPSIMDVLLESTDIVRHELAAIHLKLTGKGQPPTRVSDALLERIRQAAQTTPQPGAALSDLQISFATGVVHPPTTNSPALGAAHASIKAFRADEESSIDVIRPERRAGDASSIRIDTAKLDQLMDMVGEMVIAQTLVQHSSAHESLKDAVVQRHLTQLARITADVQRITTGMRMVPIGLQFHKTARLVRDLARQAGKQIVFESSGEDTELDKSIAEQLSDPLLHMVRNSIDHGIESSDERRASGKDPIAHIRVSAYHQSGQVVVAVTDDGRGLDRERILAKAQQNGLVPCGTQLTDTEIFQLIFEAGFSTADKVTDISGRGVGMDVVRRHVQKLRGCIDIQSKAGEGTTFFIRLPLTLAIIDGLVVMVGQQRYIVPIFSVREMFRPTDAMLSTVQGKAEMALVRGGLLPIIRLHRSFAIEPRTTDLTKGTLIVTETEGRTICLFVDELIGKQEVVIKSLGRRFKDVAGLAGCAILGDGRVGLILDIEGIYKGSV